MIPARCRGPAGCAVAALLVLGCGGFALAPPSGQGRGPGQGQGLPAGSVPPAPAALAAPPADASACGADPPSADVVGIRPPLSAGEAAVPPEPARAAKRPHLPRDPAPTAHGERRAARAQARPTPQEPVAAAVPPEGDRPSTPAVRSGYDPPRQWTHTSASRVVGAASAWLLALVVVGTLALRLCVGWPRFPPRYRGRRRCAKRARAPVAAPARPVGTKRGTRRLAAGLISRAWDTDTRVS